MRLPPLFQHRLRPRCWISPKLARYCMARVLDNPIPGEWFHWDPRRQLRAIIKR